MNTRSLSLVLFSLLLVCGHLSCASRPIPPYLENPTLHPRYGGSQYIKGIGISEESLAQAEINAKNDIAQQIRSQIQSLIEDRQKTIEREGESTTSGEFDVHIQISSHFSHVELMTIEKASAGKYNGSYYAFAYLDRRSLAGVVSEEFRETSQIFSLYYRQAMDAFRQEDLQGFTSTFNQAREAISALSEKNWEYRQATGHFIKGYEEHALAYHELTQAKEKLREKLIFEIYISDGSSSPNPLLPLVQSFFRKSGFAISECPQCTCTERFNFVFDMRVIQSCRSFPLGQKCDLRLSAFIKTCPIQNPLFQFDFSKLDVAGADSLDPRKAMENLYRKIYERESEFLNLFQEQMRRFFPL